jgi:hypothetical protein
MRILLSIWLKSFYIKIGFWSYDVCIHNVFTIIMVYWRGCCGVWFLCIVFMHCSLFNLFTKCQDENYRYLALKYGMIDMSTTLNCMLLDLVSWELLVASRIIIFSHEHYAWKALGCMQSTSLLTCWSRMYNRNRMLILQILDWLKSFVSLQCIWLGASRAWACTFSFLICIYSFISMSRIYIYIYYYCILLRGPWLTNNLWEIHKLCLQK